ncbi:tetratricopeptide repeat protein [Deinococcus sp. JMULE3]|nr:tetratricopeptide repeat protein [Deinococcus sp. JMULE3]
MQTWCFLLPRARGIAALGGLGLLHPLGGSPSKYCNTPFRYREPVRVRRISADSGVAGNGARPARGGGGLFGCVRVPGSGERVLAVHVGSRGASRVLLILQSRPEATDRWRIARGPPRPVGDVKKVVQFTFRCQIPFRGPWLSCTHETGSPHTGPLEPAGAAGQRPGHHGPGAGYAAARGADDHRRRQRLPAGAVPAGRAAPGRRRGRGPAGRRGRAGHPRGFARYQTGQFAAARQDFQAVLDRSPRYADAWYGLALVARAQGRAAEALTLNREALAIDPGRADLQQLQASLSAAQVMADGQ